MSYNLLEAAVIDAVKDAVKEQLFNDECTSIQTCLSINRIIKYLNEYQCIQISKIPETFNKANFPFLTDDYNHVLLKHLADNKSTPTTSNEYESIHNYIMQNIKECKLKTCDKCQRNNRDREKQNIFLSGENTTINIDANEQYLIETMDTMHSFFIHSFDVGFRVRLNELNNLNTDDIDIKEQKNNDEDNYQLYKYKDATMSKLSNFLQTKRQRLQNVRGDNRITNTKFVTNAKRETKEEKNENENNNTNHQATSLVGKIEETENAYVYSFGNRYNYWSKKNSQNDPFIAAKYNNLYDELINNNIWQISMENFNCVKVKAQVKMETSAVRKMKCPKDRLIQRTYKIKANVPISVEHLMSVLFYTDFDALSYNFSTTFRKMQNSHTMNDCMEQNNKYAHWSKLLCETVNAFGTTMASTKIQTFYHGIGCLLIFPAFLTTFSSPTSTTTQISVAAIFAKVNGAILELKRHDLYLRYFNCTWLSSYANEEERLFFSSTYGHLRFGSIRNMKEHHNYQVYINALVTLNYVVTAKALRGHKSTSKDYKIIDRLFKHHNIKTEYKNQFPIYINNIFNSFITNKTLITINLMYVFEEYNHMKALFFYKDNFVIKINDICSIFKSNEINVMVVHYRYDGETSKFSLSSAYLDGLLSELTSLKINYIKRLQSVKLKSVSYDESTFNEYQLKFAKQNWKLSQADYISITKL